jgi:hypothetical protein
MIVVDLVLYAGKIHHDHEKLPHSHSPRQVTARPTHLLSL